MLSNLVLPAVHALTGFDTTSKVGIKATTLKTADRCGYELLYLFGKNELTWRKVFVAMFVKEWKACITKGTLNST